MAIFCDICGGKLDPPENGLQRLHTAVRPAPNTREYANLNVPIQYADVCSDSCFRLFMAGEELLDMIVPVLRARGVA